LEASERRLVHDLRIVLDDVRSQMRKREGVDAVQLDRLAKVAHELHMSLANRGHEPRHHKYMIENRDAAPNTEEFYRHVHPVEDLLKFIEDESANDDPVDVTIGDTFDFSVYSRRWGHNDRYRLTRTKTGWVVASFQEVPVGRDGRVGRKAGTGLFHLLDHDSINYPEELPGYLDWLWERAAEDGLSHEVVQEAVTELANWVSACERATPKGVFGGFK